MIIKTEADAMKYLKTYFPKYLDVLRTIPGIGPSNPPCSVSVGGAFGFGGTWAEAIYSLLQDEALSLYLER